MSGVDTPPSATPPPTSPTSAHWDMTLSLCRAKLSPSDFDIVCKLDSVDELVDYSSSLREKFRKTSSEYEWTRLSAFLERLRKFHGGLDVLSHVHPASVAPLWGSIRLGIELVHETNEVFQMIVSMYDDIKATLPRVAEFIKILQDPESLIEPCREVHLLIAEFACLAINFFRNHPLKNVLLATWRPFHVDFDKVIHKIKQKTSQIMLEVGTLGVKTNIIKFEQVRRSLQAADLKDRARLPCHYVRCSPYPRFLGREAELEAISSHLSRESDQQLMVWLSGLGGIGKTQIALQYLHSQLTSFPAVFWISADTRVKHGEDVRGALAQLGLLSLTDASTDEQCQNMFHEWLRSTSERWLLVYDNADDPEVLRGCWPVSSHGQILVTSRNPGAAIVGHNIKSIRVDPLSDADSTRLLLQLAHGNAAPSSGAADSPRPDEMHDEMHDALSLARQLCGLPLAINQVASYILESDCTLAECVEIYSDISSRNELLILQSNTVDLNYEHSLGNVWSLSMSRVRKQNINSAHLLDILALLDPDSVPETLLTGHDRCYPGIPRKSLSYLENKAQFISARKFLLLQSIITRSGTQSKGSLSMHRLTSFTTQHSLTGSDRQARFDDVLELLSRQFPRVTLTRQSLNDQWPRCRIYIAQVIALEAFYRQSDPPLLPRSDFCRLLANACWFLFETNMNAQAMQLLPTAQSVGDATRSESLFSLATVHRALGGILLDSSTDVVAVKTHWSKVLELQKEISEFATAHGYTLLAIVKLALGDPAAAKQDITIAQEIRARHGIAAEGYRAMTLGVLGGTEAQLGNYQMGIQSYQEAIVLYDHEMGIGNYWTAIANHEIGNILVCMGDLDNAFEHHALALAMRKEHVGNTYRTAISCHKVAWHMHRRGDQTGAEELLLQAIRIYEDAYKGQSGVARSSYLLSMVLGSLGREEDSRTRKALAAKIREELTGLPPDEDDNLDSYDRLIGFQDGMVRPIAAYEHVS